MAVGKYARKTLRFPSLFCIPRFHHIGAIGGLDNRQPSDTTALELYGSTLSPRRRHASLRQKYDSLRPCGAHTVQRSFSLFSAMSGISAWSRALLLLVGVRGALAANTVIWKNYCEHDLYYWVVGPGTPESDGAYTRVPAGGEGVHTMVERWGAGIAIKFRDVPHYTAKPAGILQLEYAIDHAQNKLWYDASIIDCDLNAGPQSPLYCPFAHGGVNMYIPEKRAPLVACKDARCRLGGTCQKEMYLRPGGWVDEPTLSCGLGVDIVFETCTEMKAERTWENGMPGYRPMPKPWQAPVSVSTALTPPDYTQGVYIPPAHEPTPVAPSLDAIERPTTVYKSYPPPHTVSPTTYPVPDAGLYPTGAVCFDKTCTCFGIFGQVDNELPIKPNCDGQEGVVECWFMSDCEAYYGGAKSGKQSMVKRLSRSPSAQGVHV